MARTKTSENARGAPFRGARGDVVPLPWMRRRRPTPAPRRAPPDDPDDYIVSDRTLLTVGAFLAMLIVGSVWLLETMRANSILEECLMAGRKNCVPIETLLTRR
jgi:hypothetical protein